MNDSIHPSDELIRLRQEVEQLNREKAELQTIVATQNQQLKQLDFLQDKETLLQLVLDNIPQLIFWKDRHSTFQGCNRQWAKAAGFQHPNAVIGKTDFELYPNAKNIEQYIKKDRQVIQSGQSQTYVEYKPNKDVWYDTRKIPIRDLQGNIVGILATVEDITERKKAEQVLADYNRTLEATIAERTQALQQEIRERQHREEALELIFQGTATATGNEFFNALIENLAKVFKVQYAFIGELTNHRQTHLRTLAFWTGENLAENLEIPLSDTPSAKVVKDRACYYFENIQTDFPTNTIITTLKANSYWGFPLCNVAGEIIGVMAILDERSLDPNPTLTSIFKIFAARAGAELERKQTEEALLMAKKAADTANQAKSSFIANMSHELRTPLNAIIGFAQILSRDTALSPSHQQSLDIINRSGEHLLSLINSILEMSKIEAGQIALNETHFDLHYLLQELHKMFLLKTQTQSLQLIFNLAPDVPQYIVADEHKLRQILINLLGNAFKFTQQGSVMLEVKSQKLQANAYTLLFEIKDTGAGIATDELEKLFVAFEQTETGRKSQQGTGLGLSISRKFVQLMGGDIAVSSTVGGGSCFTFDIQVRLSSATEIALPQLKQKVVGLAANQTKYRILVVEDRPDSRLLLVTLLSSIGLQVKEASNGTEALALWETWQPHLIWMDMRMPVMDGFEATRAIRDKETKSSQNRTVIIALTASAFEEEKSLTLAAGCDDFVRKPFRESLIWEKMAQYLSVEYCYDRDEIAAPNPSTVTVQAQSVLKAEALDVMSIEWVRQLHDMARQLNRKQVFRLIEQIPAEHSILAQQLQQLAKNYRFDSIAELAQRER